MGGLAMVTGNAVVGFTLAERMMMTTAALGLEAVDHDAWGSLTAAQAKAAIEKIQLTSVINAESLSREKLPKNYLFKTRAGGAGILQILGFTESPRSVKLRYKLVQSGKN
jgi:hypothetical protein